MREENGTGPEYSGEEAVLPPAGSFILSPSPHVLGGETIRGIMLKVLCCLMPAAAASVCVFGFNAVRVLFWCAAFCVLFEGLWCLLMRKPQSVGDLSAVLTGVLLALNLPAGVPWWICAVGAFVAVIVAKQVFGGLGQNPFNPAATARVALLVGFAGPMTTWEKIPSPHFDFLTSATPLSAAKLAAGTDRAAPVFEALESAECLTESFIGYVGGSLGETSALAILLGGAGLIAAKLIKWQIPAGMLGAAAVFTGIVHLADPALTPGPLFHLMSGGMMLGAFFMATDMVTSPMSRAGAFFFGVMTGLIACAIRIWGSYPEGISFAILIMNALVPLIDRVFTKRRPSSWISMSASSLHVRRGEVK